MTDDWQPPPVGPADPMQAWMYGEPEKPLPPGYRQDPPKLWILGLVIGAVIVGVALMIWLVPS